HDALRRLQRVGEVELYAPPLIRLARGERYAIEMLVDAHEREAQVRLPGIALRVAVDEAAADPIRDERARRRIDNRRPEHEAGDDVIVSFDLQVEVPGDHPQEPGESHEQGRGLQQLNAEIRRELAQVACVLVQALVGIDADRARVREPECASRQQPVPDEIGHHPLAQLHLEGLPEPALRDVEDQQAPGDDEEDPELVDEVREVPAREGVVEGLIPLVEPNLRVSGRDDDDKDGAAQGEYGFARRRAREGMQHHAELGHEPGVRGILDLGRGASDIFRPFCHRAGRAPRAPATGAEVTIDALLENMTLAEKLGQLTMTAAGHAVTGPVIAGDSVEALRTGTVGNVLNLIGADHVHSWQRLAVEESRLRIPVLFALDILHGYRTLF